jgi:pimeloyl-ACP methyl ester carboxylesterase
MIAGGEVVSMSHSGIIRAEAEVNGISLFYRDTGSDKQPMLCLHGRWGRGETWSDLINHYRDKYRIIAPDQRGHGLSDKPVAPYPAEEFAKDMYELLHLLECGPAIVVGHSMGARMAAYLTHLHPEAVKALVILDEPADGADKENIPAPDEIVPDDGLTVDWPLPFASKPEARKFLKDRFGRESNVDYFMDSLYETARGYDFLFSRYSMAAIGEFWKSWYHILPEIRCPALLVRAAESWCLPKESADKMRALIKNCTYFEVSDSDHMVYTDNPDEFYPGFDDFLNGLDG